MIKAETQHIGANFKLGEGSSIVCKELVIGNDSVIDHHTQIFCPNGKVVIGDQCYIGSDSTIRLANFEMGEYVKLHNHALLNGVGSVKIGHNCWIGQNSVLNGEASLIIGNNVGIGTYSSVWTHGYFGQLVDGCAIHSVKDTVIEDDAWLIGSYNTVFPGVTIGKQAVLMGTSVVTKSLEPNRIYSGNPAKDVTDKLGTPYKTLRWEEKQAVLKNAIVSYFEKYMVAFSSQDEALHVEGMGHIYFNSTTANSGDVVFCEKVAPSQIANGASLFCLTNKTYTKTYSPLEILVKKILNPTVARFIPVQL